MSKYTTEVRFICENNAGLTESKGYKDIKGILTTAAPKIFDFDFPIFDEEYRLPLEIKILRHYYTREICEETVGLWKLRLEDRLNAIMPYYNKLYESELIKFNPMYDVDLIRDHKTENNGESNNTSNRVTHGESSDTSDGTKSDVLNNVKKGSSNTDSENTTAGTVDTTIKNTNNGTVAVTGSAKTSETSSANKNDTAWKLYSDTPQGGIVGIAHADDDVANMAYLTNATKDTTNGHTNTTGEGTRSSTTNQTSNGTNNGTTKVVSSDTNNGNVNTTTNDTESGTVDSESHTTNKGQTNGTENFTGKNTVTSTEDYLEHVRGKQGVISYSRMLTEFRETFLNIDKLILDELSDLFFGLW